MIFSKCKKYLSTSASWNSARNSSQPLAIFQPISVFGQPKFILVGQISCTFSMGMAISYLKIPYFQKKRPTNFRSLFLALLEWGTKRICLLTSNSVCLLIGVGVAAASSHSLIFSCIASSRSLNSSSFRHNWSSRSFSLSRSSNFLSSTALIVSAITLSSSETISSSIAAGQTLIVVYLIMYNIYITIVM